MTARDHIATARRQIDGAERCVATGDRPGARGRISGAIAKLAAEQNALSYAEGYEAAQAEHATQAQLDAQVRVVRGRDAIARVLRSWSAEEPSHDANNIATGLAGAAPGDNVLEQLRDRLRPEFKADALLVAAEVLAAWIVTERPPAEAATPDELAGVDAEGPCRAGDEERAAPITETVPPPAA